MTCIWWYVVRPLIQAWIRGGGGCGDFSKTPIKFLSFLIFDKSKYPGLLLLLYTLEKASNLEFR